MWLKIVGDVLLINLSFVLAYYLRFNILLFITPESVPILGHYFKVLVIVSLLWLAIFKLIGLYDGKRIASLLDELASLFLAISASTLFLLSLLFLYREFWFSRLVIVNAWFVAIILLGLERSFVFSIRSWLRSRGWKVRNVLILGTGEMGQVLANKISLDKNLGYNVVAFLEDNTEKKDESQFSIPILGNIDTGRIKEIIRTKKINEIIIASNSLSAERILDIVTECERLNVEFKIVPGILELIASRLDVEELSGIPLLTISEISLKGLNAIVKRSFDVFFSSIGLVVLFPLFAFFALLIKFTSAGPVFFRQERVGKDGETFYMFKFRSMVQDAEKLFPKLAPLSEVDGNLFKMKNDPRITPLGKFMRRYSIDELPQVLNVFLGQMSLVGPRPPLPREVAKYSSWHMKRLRVRPGITGPWQVAGRSLLPFEEMVHLDIYYIENWSLWLDLKILLRTVPVVLLGTGAY